MSQDTESSGDWSKEEYQEHLRKQQAAQIGDPRAAGFIVRSFSAMIDYLLIVALLLGGFGSLDSYLFDGELGILTYTEVIDQQVVEEYSEPMRNGQIRHYVKAIITLRDGKGRIAKRQFERTQVGTGNQTRMTTTLTLPLESDPGFGGKYSIPFQVFSIVLIVAYFSLMWSSMHQCTLGGKLLRLRVVDYDEQRISFLQALGRVAAFVPSAISVIGLVMIFFTERKQTMHDKIAKTLIFREPKKADQTATSPPLARPVWFRLQNHHYLPE